MSKIYQYKDKVYCEKNLPGREDYGGGLYELFLALKQDGKAYEKTTYILEYDDGCICDQVECEEYEDLINDCCEDLVIGETEQ